MSRTRFLCFCFPVLQINPFTDVIKILFCVFPQLLEAETMRHIFMNNYQLCNEISDRVVHHFVHCIETHGRHVQYLKFLETIVKADGKYVKKCQDKVMTEVRTTFTSHQSTQQLPRIRSISGEKI